MPLVRIFHSGARLCRLKKDSASDIVKIKLVPIRTTLNVRE
jgi:hypothetical protein